MMLWRDVVGYENYFSISNDGKIFSKRTNKLLKLQDHSGYFTHCTSINGTSVLLRAHRLVAEAFIENPFNKPQVNHIDGNKKNNTVENLEWVTPGENTRHAHSLGLAKAKRGIEKENSKLTEQDVEFILINYKKNGGMYSTRELGKILGVHHTNISRVLRNVSYRR